MKFYKYQGTGNDFILLDNRAGNLQLTTAQIAGMCHRRFGVGADGLMLLEQVDGYDFRMVYYNSDGSESTMCGNGGRCITAFAALLGVIGDKARFLAVDGEHTATIHLDGTISLHMSDVVNIEFNEDFTVLDTGSPHYVEFVEDVVNIDVYSEGYEIRNQDEYQPAGINVNFVQIVGDTQLLVRTYERGVEDETLSCGTGVTAAAIAATGDTTGIFLTEIETPGGVLQVSFTKDTPTSAKNVVLIGPAEFVYAGEFASRDIEISLN
ncbi:diaminopimelate epimerase [Flavipsychrobacter stenotrophus]|uniref:Diaminopimelate epimerase n=1 Tax=Flavipsychrobacter stenotrophus TaxID=2077091 RepID=A0A2S7T008_9BACT|nr:diaminopimelate epimerase [Flavipsychrobacter stenotrophus]PQJ12201.1 diaminopimelate epimerase [Flavipsychrobacter stenotrophus]